MEWLLTFVIVLLIVLVVGGGFAAMGVRGPWPSLLWFFLLLFFATWAIGAWARPVGPQAWGVPWLTFLAIAILVGLLIAAATPEYGYRDVKRLPLERDTGLESSPETLPEKPDAETEATATATVVGAFVWVFLAFAAGIFLLSLLFAPMT